MEKYAQLTDPIEQALDRADQLAEENSMRLTHEMLEKRAAEMKARKNVQEHDLLEAGD